MACPRETPTPHPPLPLWVRIDYARAQVGVDGASEGGEQGCADVRKHGSGQERECHVLSVSELVSRQSHSRSECLCSSLASRARARGSLYIL